MSMNLTLVVTMTSSRPNPQQAQQMFLQSFLARGVIYARQAKDLLTQCGVDTNSKEAIARFVNRANEAIDALHMQIKKGIEEEDGTSFYCLVMTVESPISRMSSTYTPYELELFKKLIEQIVQTEDGKIGSLAALGLTEKLDRRMGKEEAQNIFDRLEQDKWIIKGQDGKLSLSGRSLVELDQYLKDSYQEVLRMCYLCSKVCLLGEICDSCGIKIHRKCAERLFHNRTEKRCPDNSCGVSWTTQ